MVANAKAVAPIAQFMGKKRERRKMMGWEQMLIDQHNEKVKNMTKNYCIMGEVRFLIGDNDMHRVIIAEFDTIKEAVAELKKQAMRMGSWCNIYRDGYFYCDDINDFHGDKKYWDGAGLYLVRKKIYDERWASIETDHLKYKIYCRDLCEEEDD